MYNVQTVSGVAVIFIVVITFCMATHLADAIVDHRSAKRSAQIMTSYNDLIEASQYEAMWTAHLKEQAEQDAYMERMRNKYGSNFDSQFDTDW